MAKKPAPDTKQSESSIGAPGYFFGLVGRSLLHIKANPYPALLYIVLYTIASAASQLAQPNVSLRSEEYKAYEAVVNLVFIGTLPLYGLYISSKRRMSLGDFTYIQPRQFFYALATSLLVALIFILSAIALFIPLIWTLGWFALSVYKSVDEQLAPIAALRASKELCARHKRYVWGATGMLFVVTIPFVFLAYIPYLGDIGIGFATILSVVIYANLYHDLRKETA